MPTGLFAPGCLRTKHGEAWCWGAAPTQGTDGSPAPAANVPIELRARRVPALDFAVSVASGVFTYFIDGRGALWVTGTARNLSQPFAMHEYAKPVPWRPGERYEIVSSNGGWAEETDICALSVDTLLCWTERYVYDEAMGAAAFDRGTPTAVFKSTTPMARVSQNLAVAYAGIFYALDGTLSFVRTPLRKLTSSSREGTPFETLGAPERLEQAGSVRHIAAAVENNQGCVLREDRTVACYKAALHEREMAGAFDTVPGLSDVVELSRGFAYYATLANGERYVFLVLKPPTPMNAVSYIQPPKRVPVLEGGQLLSDPTRASPDCHLKDGRVQCWLEVDPKTLAPKRLFEVQGLPPL